LETPAQRHEWARDLCLEVFRVSNVKLSEGDSIILVAAVFRRMLDAWLVEHQETLDAQDVRMNKAAGNWEARLETTLKEHGEDIRTRLSEHRESLGAQDAWMNEATAAWKADLEKTLKKHGEDLRVKLSEDVDRADFHASQAVNKALSMTGRDTHWKMRGQGFLAGMTVIVIVFLLVRFWG